MITTCCPTRVRQNMQPAPQVRACGVFMAEKAPLLLRSWIYRKFSCSRPFLFAFLRKILYTISVNRLRESPNGMASASQADSRGFDSRLSLQVKRTGPWPVLFAYALYPSLAPKNLKQNKKCESRRMVWRQLLKACRGSRERNDALPRGPRNGVSADTRLSGARIRAHLAPFQHVSCFGHLRLSKLPRTRV